MPVLGKSGQCLQRTETNSEGSVSGSAMVFLVYVCADLFRVLANACAWEVWPVSSMYRNKLRGIGKWLCYGFSSTCLLCYGFPGTYLCLSI